MTKAELLLELSAARSRIDEITQAIEAIDAAPENNVFPDMETAEYAVEERLLGLARNDCEGSYNCGAEEYNQEFIVDGVHYIGTLKVEYNRHDKTYYYVDESDFSVKPK